MRAVSAVRKPETNLRKSTESVRAHKQMPRSRSDKNLLEVAETVADEVKHDRSGKVPSRPLPKPPSHGKLSSAAKEQKKHIEIDVDSDLEDDQPQFLNSTESVAVPLAKRPMASAASSSNLQLNSAKGAREKHIESYSSSSLTAEASPVNLPNLSLAVPSKKIGVGGKLIEEEEDDEAKSPVSVGWRTPRNAHHVRRFEINLEDLKASSPADADPFEELLETEEAYFKRLEILEYHFRKEFLVTIQLFPQNEWILTAREIDQLFLNIPELLDVSSLLVQELKSKFW
jgi:hypothetical protein